MKNNVSPATLVIAIALAAALIGMLGWKYMGPSNAGGSADLSAPKMDISTLKPSDFDQLRKDMAAAKGSRTGGNDDGSTGVKSGSN